MKKTALVLLVLCLLFPLAAPAEDDSFINYTDPFWGIPWGISKDAFIATMQEDHGLTFIPTDDGKDLILENPEDFYFLGEPLEKVRAYFIGENLDYFSDDSLANAKPEDFNSYFSISFYFLPPSGNTTPEVCLPQFERVFQKLYRYYGKLTEDHLMVFDDPDDPSPDTHSESNSYLLPHTNGILDLALIQKAIASHDSILLRASFRNRSLVLYNDTSFSEPSYYLLSLQISDFSFQSLSDLTPYPNE